MNEKWTNAYGPPPATTVNEVDSLKHHLNRDYGHNQTDRLLQTAFALSRLEKREYKKSRKVRMFIIEARRIVMYKKDANPELIKRIARALRMNYEAGVRQGIARNQFELQNALGIRNA